MNITRIFIQLFKFGVSGILGVTISATLFYGFKGQLPIIIWFVGYWYWIYPLDVLNMAFYVLTTCIGGSMHFFLSKLWVFAKSDQSKE
jgi:hypothetical protein